MKDPTKNDLKHLCLCSDVARIAIQLFRDEVMRSADEKMNKTGKLEGAHLAAMEELMKEIMKPERSSPAPRSGWTMKKTDVSDDESDER